MDGAAGMLAAFAKLTDEDRAAHQSRLKIAMEKASIYEMKVIEFQKAKRKAWTEAQQAQKAVNVEQRRAERLATVQSAARELHSHLANNRCDTLRK